MKVSIIVRSLFLSSPKFKSHPCRASKYVPTVPELPKIFCVTNLTVSSVMSMGIKIRVFSYVPNMAQEGMFLCRFSPARTDVAVSLIEPVQSSANSPGCKTPLFTMHRQI